MTKIILCLLIASTSQASTFIGNGGSAGDVELLVALKQIEKTTEFIAQNKSEKKFCECNPIFEGHSVCEALKKLTPPQRQYCESFITKEAGQYSTLLKSKNVRFLWTHDNIDVFENKRRRAVEAVANAATNEITINQLRFIELRAYERIFLMAHELTHLIEVDKKTLNDEDPMGPFEGQSGTRELINSVAAAVVMQAAENNLISQYRSALDRPKGYKKFWLDLNSGKRTFGKITGNKTFGFSDSGSAVWLGARYYFADNFGAYVGYRNFTEAKKILTSIDAEEKLQSFSLGITYKYFPFSDPLKYLGQSHLEVYGGLDSLKASYTVKDPFVGTDDKDNSIGFLLGATYRLPVIWGFWLTLGASAEMHNYKFDQVNVEYNGPQFTSYIGASYGF